MKVDKITYTFTETLAGMIINNYKKSKELFRVTYVYLLKDDTLEVTHELMPLEYLLWDSSLYPSNVTQYTTLKYKTHLSRYLYQTLQKRYSDSVAYRRKSNQGYERMMVKTILNSTLQGIRGVNRTEFSTGQEQLRGNTYVHINYHDAVINTIVFTVDYIVLLKGKESVSKYFIPTDRDEREILGDLIKLFQPYIKGHIEELLEK